MAVTMTNQRFLCGKILLLVEVHDPLKKTSLGLSAIVFSMIHKDHHMIESQGFYTFLM